MRQLRMGTNVALFVLLFGITLLDAFRKGAWLVATFWCVIALGFVAADSVKRPRSPRRLPPRLP